MLQRLIVGVIALALPLAVLAAGTVQSAKGDVQAGGVAVKQGQTVVPPTAVTTGPGGQVFLKFQDDMEIVLGENSLLRIIDFRYAASGATDRAVFELLRGSARVVTGKIAAANPQQFFFRTPQTQLSVERPSDFTVALVNPAYIAVKSGSVVSANGYGTTSLGAGSTSMVASNAVAPVAISPFTVPATAASSMGALSVAQVGAPAGGGAAAGAAATTAGGGTAFAAPLLIGGAALAGAAALASSGNDNDAAQPSTPVHH